MSRPLRIEYPGAYYHVMNRGAGRQLVFQHNDHRSVFLELLRDVHEMFSAQIHAYCLMDNHYHLLLSTPKGNLGRIMRHLNGVYTQRYNRMQTTDGPLFRGRYKAILVDVDSYLLNVSRYIHLNPVVAGIVKKASPYRWSSYPAYTGFINTPPWLTTSQTLGMIGQRNQRQRYKTFVEQGIDQETAKFYDRKKGFPILGTEGFIERIMRRLSREKEIPESRQNHRDITLRSVVSYTAKVFDVTEQDILISARGRGRINVARGAALYLCRKHGGHSLTNIAEHFGLSHYGSASGAISRFDKLLAADDRLKKKVERLLKTINKQT